MKRNRNTFTTLVMAAVASLVICAVVSNAQTVADETYGFTGKKITKKTKNAEGSETTETSYLDPKGKLRKKTTETTDEAGGTTTETEKYTCDGKLESTVLERKDPSGRMTIRYENYNKEGVLEEGNIFEYDKEGMPSGYKEYDPVTQKYVEKTYGAPLGPPITRRQETLTCPIATSGYKIDTNTNSGLVTVGFTTPHGEVNVYVPDDLAAGDTFSGTIEQQLAGRSEAERTQSQSELNHYVVELEKQSTKVSEKTFTRNIPTALTISDRIIRLLRDDGEVARTEIPISGEPYPISPGLILPTGGQQGRLLEVRGPCNGLFSNTDYVKIGETIMPVLAESPRKTIVRDASEVVGPTKIECSENGKVTECPFRNLGIKLSANKLALLRGETTTLQVVVTGLAGINESVPLELVNKSPAVIDMAGGVEQHMAIRAGDVRPDGTYSTDRTLTGIQSGSFGITATVRWQNLCKDGQPYDELVDEEETERGSFARDVNGPPDKDGKPTKYRTCGGQCKSPVTDPSGTYCGQDKSCSDNQGCQCHMYDSKGVDDISEWKHVWKPGDSKKVEDPNFRCLCVKPK